MATSLEAVNKLMVTDLIESIQEVLDLATTEMRLRTAQKVVLVGFDQGCAAGIHALLVSKIRWAGFIGFGGWLPLRERIETLLKNIPKNTLPHYVEHAPGLGVIGNAPGNAGYVLNTPIFLSQSNHANVVPGKYGMDFWKTLKDIGFKVAWKYYLISNHWIKNAQGMNDIMRGRGGWRDAASLKRTPFTLTFCCSRRPTSSLWYSGMRDALLYFMLCIVFEDS